MFQFWKFCKSTFWESTMNWLGIGHYITAMLSLMSLLLFSNILLIAILKSCHILFTVQIWHHVISGCFQSWKRWSVAEKIIQILKLFQQSRVLWNSFQKKPSLLAFKSELNDGTIAYHLREGALKMNDLFFIVNIFLYFFMILLQF